MVVVSRALSGREERDAAGDALVSEASKAVSTTKYSTSLDMAMLYAVNESNLEDDSSDQIRGNDDVRLSAIVC